MHLIPTEKLSGRGMWTAHFTWTRPMKNGEKRYDECFSYSMQRKYIRFDSVELPKWGERETTTIKYRQQGSPGKHSIIASKELIIFLNAPMLLLISFQLCWWASSEKYSRIFGCVGKLEYLSTASTLIENLCFSSGREGSLKIDFTPVIGQGMLFYWKLCGLFTV